MIKPTEEQQEIIEATRSSSESLMINAYAGCAKTTSLELLGRQVKVPGLALAFNKSISVELSKRFNSNFKISTMNGFGYGALMRARPGVVKWEIDGKKVGKLVSQVARDWKIELASEDWEVVRGMVEGAQGIGLKSEGIAPEPVWVEIAQNVGARQGEVELFIDLARESLRRSNELVEKGIISFDDQVYYPVAFKLPFPKFPVMLVDEAQDLSSLQHEMIRQSLRSEGRLVVCGDSRQAIYAFRGAHSHSMAEMIQLRDSWKSLPLTLTFRCPKVVVERQKDHAPGFRAFEGNREGVFAGMFSYGDERWEGWNFVDVIARRMNETDSMAILCRNNAPLLSLAFKLIREGVGVVMLGRDLGKGLSGLAKKIAAPDGDSLSLLPFFRRLMDWEAGEKDLVIANGQEERVAGIVDRAECLRAVGGGGGSRDVGELRRSIEKLFSNEQGLVVLGSIHKSKGLEWDLVLHLDSWRVPSKHAKRVGGEELKQEWNLKYVCETRTKNVLIEANLEDYSIL